MLSGSQREVIRFLNRIKVRQLCVTLDDGLDALMYAVVLGIEAIRSSIKFNSLNLL